MIELGKFQTLEIMRETSIGVFLNYRNGDEKDDILLPKKSVPSDVTVGDEIEVFIYRDSEDRKIATTKKPKLTIDTLGVLEVVDTTKIGAFLDWGLEKDLFLPFKQQVGNIEKGKSYLVGLYIDKADRLCATMKVYELLSCEAPYKINDVVRGYIYRINDSLGAFVAVENKYNGLILHKELYGNYKVGDTVDVRIKNIREDGKLDLSLRKEAYMEIEGDSKKIMDFINENDGKVYLNDKSSPEDIKRDLNMSKGAFKRAVGRLLKEGAIKINDDSIERMW